MAKSGESISIDPQKEAESSQTARDPSQPVPGMARIILNDGRSILARQTEDSFGNPIVDVSKFFSETGGAVLLDEGFMSTASCLSRITYINGAKGILLYRGYPIEQIIAFGADQLEVAQLLLNGELPTQTEDLEFRRQIARRMSDVHAQIGLVLDRLPIQEHPIMMLSTMTTMLADPCICPIDTSNLSRDACLNLIAKVPVLAAMAYRHRFGRRGFVPHDPKLGYGANFLNMCFNSTYVNGKPWELTDASVRAIEQIFVLHADHEQNASTSTVRLSGSTGNSPFAAVVAGIMSLSGAAHGGANEAVLRQLDNLLADTRGDIDKAVYKAVALAKTPIADGGGKLMGFGHRIYKNFDPRATALHGICKELLAEIGVISPRLELAERLEVVATTDPYFVEKKLYPNVDFFSGIILDALGFPPEMFTPIFAVGRTTGWVAQYDEMLQDPKRKIGRPRQGYLGERPRDYIPHSRRADLGLFNDRNIRLRSS